MKTFNPRFDVRELADAYELHGELPGVEQKDIEIEFTDPQTLTIRGRIERTYTSGTPPSNLVEGTKSSGAITEGGEQQQRGEQQQSHKATVEDEGAAKASQDTAVATQEQAKYWVSERSVGEFARSFSFPTRVDQDAVKASMKNGILSILVPKAKKHESRKITIS
jgi:HSP20 family molecular chaperone IbpA